MSRMTVYNDPDDKPLIRWRTSYGDGYLTLDEARTLRRDLDRLLSRREVICCKCGRKLGGRRSKHGGWWVRHHKVPDVVDDYGFAVWCAGVHSTNHREAS